MKNQAIISLTLAAGLLVTGCASSTSSSTGSTSTTAAVTSSGSTSDAAEGEVQYTKHTIAVSVPLTGNNAQYGIAQRDMVQLAVDQFNEAGGFGDGEEIKVEVYDDKGDAVEGLNVAELIAENDDVFAAVASYGSTVSLVQAPVFEEAQIPMLSPNTSHVDFPGLGDMMIPLNPTSANSYDVIAEFFYEEVSPTLAILYQNTEQGVTSEEILQESYEALGGTVTDIETYVPGETTDFTALLAKIRESGAEAIFINGDYIDASKAVLQWKDMDGTEDITLLVSGNCLIDSFFDIVGYDQLEGTIFASTSRVYSDSLLESYTDYVKEWAAIVEEQYPDDGVNGFTASPYDAAVLALDAAAKVGTTDPVALEEQIRKVDHDIVSAESLSFARDENGVYQLTKAVSRYIIQNGEAIDWSAREQ